jgi:hypothetical protein
VIMSGTGVTGGGAVVGVAVTAAAMGTVTVNSVYSWALRGFQIGSR